MNAPIPKFRVGDSVRRIEDGREGIVAGIREHDSTEVEEGMPPVVLIIINLYEVKFDDNANIEDCREVDLEKI